MISFANPAFLYLGFLLSIPVIIHLMRQQNATSLVFPSISFIIKGKMPREGKRKLRDILLLLVRLLIYSLVIIALADPKIGGEENAGAGLREKTQTAILLDSSASMGGWSSFANSEKILGKILDDNPGSEFLLATSSGRLRIAADWTRDRNGILRKFRSLRPDLAQGRHQDAVAEILKTFRPGAMRKICVVSDFQLTDWSFPPSALPPGNMSVELFDCSPSRGENVGITDAQTIRTGQGCMDILARVQNFGISDQTRTISVKTASGRIEKNIAIPAGKTIKTIFPVGRTPSEKTEISLGADLYPPDDSFFLWTGDEPPLRMAAFSRPESAEDIFFLQKAFSSAAETAGQFDFSSLDIGEFARTRLDSLSVIFLAGSCSSLGDAEYAKLARFLDEGGTAVVTPGPEPGKTFQSLRKNKLFNADYLGSSDTGGGRGFMRISQIDAASPFYSIFAENENSDLTLFPIFRFARLSPAKPAETLISMEDNLPFLARQINGKGTLYVFATDFSLDASEFPITGSFLPLMHEIAFQGAKNRKDKLVEISCGEEVPQEYSAAKIAGSGKSVDERAIFTEPGVLCEEGKIPVQVNVSRLESVTEKQSVTALRKKLVPSDARSADSEVSGAESRPGESPRKGLAAFAALLAILAAIAETVISSVLEGRKRLAEAEGA